MRLSSSLILISSALSTDVFDDYGSGENFPETSGDTAWDTTDAYVTEYHTTTSTYTSTSTDSTTSTEYTSSTYSSTYSTSSTSASTSTQEDWLTDIEEIIVMGEVKLIKDITGGQDPATFLQAELGRYLESYRKTEGEFYQARCTFDFAGAQKAMQRRKHRQTNIHEGIVDCECAWYPQDIQGADSQEDLEKQFEKLMVDIFDTSVKNVELQYIYAEEEPATTEPTTTESTTTESTTLPTTTTYYYSTGGSTTTTLTSTESTSTTDNYLTYTSPYSTTDSTTTTESTTSIYSTSTTSTYSTTTLTTETPMATILETGTNAPIGTDACDNGNHGGCSHTCENSICSCPECWELMEDAKTCQPVEGTVLLDCHSDSMTVKLNKCLAPDARDVTLLDSACKAEDELTGDFYSLTTGLDSCSTGLSQDENGDLIFSNEVLASAVHNSIIFTSAETRISFHCSYRSVYDNITTEHIVHTAEFNGGEEGNGKLSFSIVKHDDDSFDTPVDEDSISIVGDIIYFSVDIETPIVGVEFAIAECVVRDDAIGKNFTIIQDGCMSSFINVQSNAVNLTGTNKVGVSFKAFQFVESEDDVATLKIACTAVACAADEDDTFCKKNNVEQGTCEEGRRKRHAPEASFNVTKTLKVNKTT